MATQTEALQKLIDYSRDPQQRIVILRGATGVGKTWVLQQFYNHLQSNDDYWPVLDTSDENFLESRKKLCPSLEAFNRERGVLPSFGWWTFNCEELFDNSLTEVASTLNAQVAAHLPYLLAAKSWRAEFSPAELGKKAKELAKRIAVNTPAEALSLMGLAVPFAGLVLEQGAGAVKAMSARTKTNAEREPGKKALRDIRQSARETAQAIADVATKGCPGFIVVEDIHRMPKSLGVLIDDILASNAPVTVIATQWPESDVVQQWLANSPSRDLVEYIDVEAPDEQMLVDILQAEAPGTSVEDAQQFVQPPLDNPLMLKWWLELPYVRFEIELDQSIAYDHDLVPVNAHSLVQQQWHALPEVTRAVLEFAAATAPRHPGGAEAFPRALIVDAIRDLNIDYLPRDVQEIEAAFHHAVSPALWCATAEGIQSFTEPGLASVATEQADIHYRGRLKTIARERLSQQLERWILDNSLDGVLPHEPLSRLVADWLIALDPTGSAAVGAAHRLKAEVHADHSDFPTAEESARAAIHAFDNYPVAASHMERFARSAHLAQPQPEGVQPALNAERRKLEEWARENNYDMLGYSLLEQAIQEEPATDDPELDTRIALWDYQRYFYTGFGSQRSAPLVEEMKAAAPGIERIMAREKYLVNVIVDPLNEDEWYDQLHDQFTEFFEVFGPEDKRTLGALDAIPERGGLPRFFQIRTSTLRILLNAAQTQAGAHPERAEDLQQLAESISLDIDLDEMYPDTPVFEVYDELLAEQQAFGLQLEDPISREGIDAVLHARRTRTQETGEA